jgi:hypothetical protein
MAVAPPQADPAVRSPLERWGALGGVLYVVLYVIGVIILFNGAPDSASAPAKIQAWYGDSGHRNRIAIGWILAGLGLFFLIWFIGSLREAVRAGDRTGFLGAIVAIGGAIYVAIDLAALGLDMGIRTMSDDTYHHTVYAGVIHAADDASYVMHSSGTAGMAAMIFAASAAILAGRGLPRWLGWFGLLAGLAALVSILFFTNVVWLLWILVASLLLFARASRGGYGTQSAPR